MYVCVQPLQQAHAEGIYGVINKAFVDLGVNNWQSKVVAVGCDGAAVNDSDIRRRSVYNPNALCGSSLGT